MYRLGELADRLDLKFSGDAHREIAGLATLAMAGPADLAFMVSEKFLSQLARTRAAAVILAPEFVDQCPADCLISDSPYLAYARVSRLFERSPQPLPGVHSSAVVAADARVHASAAVGPNAVIEAGAVVAAGAVVGANVYLGHN
ncbi:MAG: UDP-3-O-(3-hydroxymyristoyl)glucosamine N-acyltransferase, partial [Xanthomonadales bacterium]|nr:UDP-3-O-(3-hydroxymyristoyl)glucosamine N-acyltransferase [Xanthomonadales bacterium]